MAVSTTKTDVLPDVTELEDFAVPCDIKTAVVINGKVVGTNKPCENTATWAANYPCCGRLILCCDQHRLNGRTYFCAKCQKVMDPLEWRKL